MRQASTFHTIVIALVVCDVVAGIRASGQLEERPFSGSPGHPAIDYGRRSITDSVSDLNRKLGEDAARLTFDDRSGYLRSVLQALDISVDSQMLVFSRTGVQAARKSPTNPRALFFNDSVIVGI